MTSRKTQSNKKKSTPTPREIPAAAYIKPGSPQNAPLAAVARGILTPESLYSASHLRAVLGCSKQALSKWVSLGLRVDDIINKEYWFRGQDVVDFSKVRFAEKLAQIRERQLKHAGDG